MLMDSLLVASEIDIDVLLMLKDEVRSLTYHILYLGHLSVCRYLSSLIVHSMHWL